MKNKKFVTYEEFGALGDGKTNDFAAIKQTHDYANENGVAVKVTEGKTYYISDTRIDGEVQTVSIMTDVDWRGASFIIDDSCFTTHNDVDILSVHIFRVASEYPMWELRDEKLFEKVLSEGVGIGTKKIDLGLGYDALIIIYNSNHTVYRRRGYADGHRGQSMHEIIYLDKDGNVSEETPIMFDYNGIDYINVIRADLNPITIEGGKFTTLACNTDCVVYEDGKPVRVCEPYLRRGIIVSRSETTLRGVEHYVEGEISINRQKKGEIGAPYYGFYQTARANHVTFDSCVMTGRRCYQKAWITEGFPVGTMGTYDLTADMVNKIVFKNCVQSNFWVTIDENNVIHPATEDDEGAVLGLSPILNDSGWSSRMHWGVGGTNYCKNMEYIGCTLSRFDAHQGLYNGKIIDSTLVCIALTGGGDMLIENSRIFSESHTSNNMISTRSDFGSLWNGSVTVNGLKSYVYTKRSSLPNAPKGEYKPTGVMSHTYTNWYYGYDCYFPCLSLSDVEVYDIETRQPIPDGSEISLVGGNMCVEPALHLERTLRTPPIYPDVDKDGDGLVDGTDIPYDDVVDIKGVVDKSSNKNLNPIRPPKYMKVFNNKHNYVYTVNDMSKYDGVTDGGFFGKTEFVADDETYIGTNHPDKQIKTFKFI